MANPDRFLDPFPLLATCDNCSATVEDNDYYALPDARWVCFDCWNEFAP